MTDHKEVEQKEYRVRVDVIRDDPYNYWNLFYYAASDVGLDLEFEPIPEKLKKSFPGKSMFVSAPSEEVLDKVFKMRDEFAKQNSHLYKALQIVSEGTIEFVEGARNVDPNALRRDLTLALRNLLDHLK